MKAETAQVLVKLHERRHPLAALVHPATQHGQAWQGEASPLCSACKRPPAVRLVVELETGNRTLCPDCWRLWIQGAFEVGP